MVHKVIIIIVIMIYSILISQLGAINYVFRDAPKKESSGLCSHIQSEMALYVGAALAVYPNLTSQMGPYYVYTCLPSRCCSTVG